jgi:hypothetical protein
MVSVELFNNNIMISCSCDQLINVEKLKEVYHLSLDFVKKNGNLPVIVDLEKGARLSDRARKIFTRFSNKNADLTLVIISVQG